MKYKTNISFAQKFTERFLILITILSFINCALSLIKDLLPLAHKNVINLFTLLIIDGFALLAFLIITIFFSEKTRTTAKIRLYTYSTLLAAAISYFLRSWINFPLVILGTATSVILIDQIFYAFFEHDGFEKQCLAKNNVELQKELYDANVYLTEAAAGYRKNRVILTVLGIILAFLTVINFTSGTLPGLLSIILLFIYIICFYVHLFLYSHYVREAVYASDGFTNVFDFRLKVFFTSICIFSISFLLALIISSNHSPLKISYLGYIFKLFHKKDTAPKDYVYDQTQDIFARRLRELQSYQFAVTEGKDTKGTFAFAIICGAFFVFGILWFFLSPFFKRVFSKALRNLDLKALFRNFFKNIKKMLKNLFHLKFSRPLPSTENARRFSKDMTEFLKKSHKSKEKKAELDRLTKIFMKLIDWGTAKGIEYTKNLTAAEYTRLLNNEDALEAGLLFEKALYDKECLSADEEKIFNQKIDKVLEEGSL